MDSKTFILLGVILGIVVYLSWHEEKEIKEEAEFSVMNLKGGIILEKDSTSSTKFYPGKVLVRYQDSLGSYKNKWVPLCNSEWSLFEKGDTIKQ